MLARARNCECTYSHWLVRRGVTLLLQLYHGAFQGAVDAGVYSVMCVLATCVDSDNGRVHVSGAVCVCVCVCVLFCVCLCC